MREGETESEASGIGAVDIRALAIEYMERYNDQKYVYSTGALVRLVIADGRHGVLSIPGVETTADLTVATVDEVVRRMREARLARTTIHARLCLLRRLCSYAVRRGHLATNPVEARPYNSDRGAGPDYPPGAFPWIPPDYEPGTPGTIATDRGDRDVPEGTNIEAIDIAAFADGFLKSYAESHAPSTGPRVGLSAAFFHARHGLLSIDGVETTADLTEDTIEKVVARLIERRLKRATIRVRIGLLHMICEHAIERGYIATNPVEARRVDGHRGPPGRLRQGRGDGIRWAEKPTWIPPDYDRGGNADPVDPVEPLTAGELARLMEYLKGESSRWETHRLYALVALIVHGGLGYGQALAMMVSDFDLDAGTMTVNGPNVPESRRIRPIPAELAEVLRGWLPRTGCPFALPGSARKTAWRGVDTVDPGRSYPAIEAAGRAVGIEGLTARRLKAGPSLRLSRAAHVHAPRTSGPPPVLEVPEDRHPIVRSARQDRPATKKQALLLRAMIEAGTGLTEDELRTQTGIAGPVVMLHALRKKFPVLHNVIVLPGKGWQKHRGGGYRLASE